MVDITLILLTELLAVIAMWSRILAGLLSLLFHMAPSRPEVPNTFIFKLRFFAIFMISKFVDVSFEQLSDYIFFSMHVGAKRFIGDWVHHGMSFSSAAGGIGIRNSELPMYHYGPLPDDVPLAIRLIKFHEPDGISSTEPIKCSMVDVSVGFPPRFTALSYAWDSEHGNETIICDGGRINVTKNCAAGLRNIINEDRQGWIWIDAICINPAPMATEEKRRQIAIMGEIYKRAACVRVWLGQEDRSSTVVCEYFNKLSGLADRYHRISDDRREPEKVAFDMARKWPRLTSSLIDFYSRSWFTRAWPVQEVTLPDPDRVDLVCGNTHLKLCAIRLGWHVLKDLGVFPPSAGIDHAVSLHFYLADAIALKRKTTDRTPGSQHSAPSGSRAKDEHFVPLLTDLSQFSFTMVMNAMRFKACRDAKDRFFSLWGVFKELEIDHGIPISMWAKTDVEVFEAVTLACFKLDGNLEAIRLAQQSNPYMRLFNSSLACANYNPYDMLSRSFLATSRRLLLVGRNWRAGRNIFYTTETKTLVDLPSWIPDWTQPISPPVEAAWQITMLETNRFVPPRSTDKAVYYRDEPDLKLEVKILGRIAEIGTVNSFQLFWQIVSAPIRYYNTFPQTPDPILSALAETVSNFTLRSHVSQIVLSFRMTLCSWETEILALATSAGIIAVYFGVRAFNLFCPRFLSVDSCPSNSGDPSMRPFSPDSEDIWACLAILDSGHVMARHQERPRFPAIRISAAAVLLWRMHGPILERLLGANNDEINPLLVLLLLGRLLSVVSRQQVVASGGTITYLLAWSLSVLCDIGFLIVFALWLWGVAWSLLLPVGVAAHALIRRFLQDRSPGCVVASFWRISGWFRESKHSAVYDTQGSHFFVTDTGFTGNASALLAIDHGDYLVQLRGSTTGGGYLILRPKHGKTSSYVVIGAAYVGMGQPMAVQIIEEATWKDIWLC